MTRIWTFCALAAALLATASCAGYGPNQTLGGLGGAAGGGLLGAQFGSGSGRLASVAAGTLIGALVGSEIGRTMDEVDRLRIHQAHQQASVAPVGQTILWQNPNTGNSGTVVTTRQGMSATGRYCREFQNTVVVGGRVQESYGIACRQPDGSWELR